jgi:mannose-1-phosphate guanylyltransferase
MQALILVGGEGTRLRPLTATVPKPVITLVDRPFMAYMLEWLRSHGIDEIVFSLGFKADRVRAVLGDGSAFGVSLTYVEEPAPMGTGGAVKYAEDHLDERFVMLNGDVLTDIDLSAQIAQHERTGARGTIALVPVDDPSAYGLVRLGGEDRIEAFLEKPEPHEIDTDLINAGVYVLEREVFSALEAGAPASIERDLFPRLVGEGLYGYRAAGYWLDIGTPDRYLQGTYDILSRAVRTEAGAALDASGVGVGDRVSCAGTIEGPAVVGDGAQIGAGARVGPRTVIGPGVVVGARTAVCDAVILEGCRLGEDAEVRGSIVAPGVRIGQGSRIEPGAVIGQDAIIGRGNVIINGARVQPGESIPESENAT